MKKFLITFLALALMCNIALAESLTADRAVNVERAKISPISSADLSNVATPKPQVGIAPTPNQNIILQGGDNVSSPTVIASLPYSDNGTTVGYTNDYAGSCSSDNGAPDVVYSYAPAGNASINIELCGSSFDTRLYVFENSPSTEIACNDDDCALQSRLTDVSLTAGNTYYIVVDGYWVASGAYVINVTENLACDVVCPAASIPEGEPACGDDYVDATNGGCNSAPPVFGSIADGDTICGTSGTFILGGSDYRDTDWYLFTITEAKDIVTSVVAEFDVNFYLIQMGNPDLCTGYTIVSNTNAAPCVTASIESTIQPGSYVIWVGPSTYTGVPCNSDYFVSLNFTNPPGPPANDNCANATSIGDVNALPFSTTLATFDGSGGCLTSPNVWYLFSNPDGGQVTVSLCGSSYDTKVAVYDGSNCDAAQIGCNDDFCNLQSQLVFTAAPGSDYLIEIGGWQSSIGDGVLTVTTAAPPQDPCTNSVYHNGSPDWINGLACDRRADGSLEAWIVDDVVVSSSIDIEELHFWTLTQNGYDFQNTGDVVIYNNDGANGTPGSVVVELNDVPATREDLGETHFNIPAYIYEISGLNIHLNAGTYFIGMRPVNSGTIAQNYWGTTAVNGSEIYFKSVYFGYPNFVPGSTLFGGAYDVAFCISGTATSVDDNNVPTKVNILSNYPNPFNPSTDISFAALKNGDVRLEVFNLTGQKVRTLIDGYMMSGPKSVKWDGKSDNGSSVSSGVYYYKLTTEDGVQVKKMTLMK